MRKLDIAELSRDVCKYMIEKNVDIENLRVVDISVILNVSIPTAQRVRKYMLLNNINLAKCKEVVSYGEKA